MARGAGLRLAASTSVDRTHRRERVSLAHKLKSAAGMLRRKGLSDTAGLARLRAAEFFLAHRPVPSDPARRARMLGDTLNRWSGVSAVAVSEGEARDARDALLVPYLRHRFAEVAAVAANLAPLRPVEVVILADSLLSAWAFERIDAAWDGWARAVAGTHWALRIAQTGRRAALRLGRIADAARDLEGGRDLGSLLVRADVLDAAGRLDEAGAAYEAAVQRDGGDAYARQSHAFHLLKAGRIRDGFASWHAADVLFGTYPLRHHRPHWAGEPLGRRRLMVLFEHGLGDMIQMARFLPRLRAREPAAVLLARVPAPLAGLLRRSFPSVCFVTEDQREPDYDLFVPSMQLPAVLDATDLAPLGHYIDLGAPAPRSGARVRVGVCWRGHPRQYEATRSVALATFAALFAVEGADFVVLLNRLTAAEQAGLAAHPRVAAPPIRDFVDLAALTSSCDLVVSVDTAVAHLAAAGGVPTLLLARPDSCWRWGAAGAAAPWYDTVDVLRHPGDMDWPRVLAAAAARVRDLCAASSRP